MKVRWSPEAADDLEAIVTYVRRERPQAARRVARAVYEAVGRLGAFPMSGRARPGRSIRELILPGLPYLIAYRVRASSVEILRVIHGVRDWKPGK